MNKCYHERVGQTVHGLIAFIKGYNTEIYSLENITTTIQNQATYSWEPPERDIRKANFDASFQKHLDTSITMILFRNKK